jgi:translation initiation factor RLI1
MVVAGQAALNAGKITKAKPNLQAKITYTLPNIDQIHRGKQTELMKAYALGALNDYFDEIADKEKIVDFVKAQLVSASPKTRKAAKIFFREAGCKVSYARSLRNRYVPSI